MEQQNGSFTLAFALRRQTLFRVQDDTRGAALGGEVLWPASRKNRVCYDMMTDGSDRSRQEKLEAAVEALRKKHGDGSITLGYQENLDIGVKRNE